MWGLICTVLFLLSGNVYAQDSGHKIKAVATFSVIGDLVQNVAGSLAEVVVLVGPDGDVHTYEPAPKDNVALTEADVIFENGLHMEPWLDRLYQSSAAHGRRVLVTESVEPIVLKEGNHDDVDPHVWHDVSNVMIMVERIRDGLIQADQAHAESYSKNAREYLSRLGDLNHWIIDNLKDIPDERRILVTSHDTFGYFARRYDFKIIGAAIESATTEAADPSAAQIARLVEKIKSSGVKIVFGENMHNPRVLHSIATEASVRTAPALYTDALGKPGTGGDTYVKMMEYNTRILKENLE